jgi:glycosyltransferase involved in cell wall biosynthesis
MLIMDSMERPFFSICIPNFNYGAYIEETINSVLCQTFQDFEIIIADNCSTDNSLEVIKKIDDNRINIIVNNVNLGMSLNLDIATKHSNGEFIILLSSDDLMKPLALETYYNVIKNYDSDRSNLVLFSAFDIIDGRNKIVKLDKQAMPNQIDSNFKQGLIDSIKTLDGVLISGRDAVKIMLQSTLGSTGQFCTTCYSKHLYNRVEGYSSSTSLVADATFIHKLGLTGADFYYLKKNLFQYRVHEGNNLSGTLKMSNIKFLIDNYLICQNYEDQLLSKIGLTKDSLIVTFVNHVIFKATFWSLMRGNSLRGIRHLAFGVATYPDKVMLNFRFFGLIALIVLSPFLGILFKFKKFLQGNK